jgi:hypothetical protein
MKSRWQTGEGAAGILPAGRAGVAGTRCGAGRQPPNNESAANVSLADLCRQGAHLATTTNIRGSAKRNAAFTLQHGAMLAPRQPEGCVPVVVSRCARRQDAGSTLLDERREIMK